MHKKRKKIPKILFLVLLITIVLVGTERTRLLVWRAISPTVKILVLSNQELSDYWRSIKGISSLAEENSNLKQENADLKRDQGEIETLRFENKKLQAMLNFNSARSNLIFRNGQVVGRSSLGSLSTIVINLGSSDEVKEGNLVINNGFLIGVITATTSHSSEVGLITGNSVKIAAILQNSRGLGVLSGGNNGIVLENIAKDNKIIPGETILTAGITNNTRPDIPIGTVDTVTSDDSDIYQSMSVKSPIDFNKIEYISVVL